MTEQFQHLSTKKCERLIALLRKLEYFFDSTLGTYNNTPLYLELKDDGKPVCSCPFPVQRMHKAIKKK